MDAWRFNLDPVLLDLGPLQIRYYGLIFAITILIGFSLWRWQMLRGGHSYQKTNNFLIWGVFATLIGARLGHCFFYNAETYLKDPVQILYFWEGGLASHGATVGLLVALIAYAKVAKLHVLEIMDRFAFSAAVGSAGIRLGNFLNSEIVGRPTDVPWAVIFERLNEDPPVPRHPSQIYEFLMGLAVLGILLLADRWAGKEKRPLGLMAGLFLTLYFAGRFAVEYFKAYHIGWLSQNSPFTMGQYLSILPHLAGVGLLIWTARRRLPTNRLRRLDALRAAKTEREKLAARPSGGKGRRRHPRGKRRGRN